MILRKVIKIAATRCHISKAKMHQIRLRLGLRPRPRWGAYSAPTDPLAGFKGPTSKGRKGREGKGDRKGRKRSEKRKGEGGGKGKEGRGRGQGWEGKFRGQGKGRERGREKGRGGKI